MKEKNTQLSNLSKLYVKINIKHTTGNVVAAAEAWHTQTHTLRLPKYQECCVCALSCVQLFVTPWTIVHHASLSMGFPRQEYWNRLPFPTPGDLPNPGIELASPALQADSLPSQPPGKMYPLPIISHFLKIHYTSHL